MDTLGKRSNTVAYSQLVADNSVYKTFRGFYVSKETKKIIATKFFQDWAIMHM